MQRRTLFIALALAAGSIALNVAVAWACARWSKPGNLDPMHLASLRREFFIEAEASGVTGRELFVAIAYRGFGVEFIDVAIEEADKPSHPFHGPMSRIAVLRAGWPWRGMEARCYHDASRSPAKPPEQYVDAIVVPGEFVRADRLLQPVMLPLNLRWLPFIANSIVWAALLGLVLFVPAWLRRGWRRWRKQCQRCGYPIGVSAICTECGSKLHRSAITALQNEVSPRS